MRAASFALSVVSLGCGGSDGSAPMDGGTDRSPSDSASEGSPDVAGDGPSMCNAHPITLITTRPCGATTVTCVDACTEPGCAVECIEADPNADCLLCANVSLVACYNRNGCQDEWDCNSDCIAEHCPMGGLPCLMSMCGDLGEAWIDCTEAPGNEICMLRYADCLPEK